MPSLYIHIPFCRKKCYYCSFVVAVAKENLAESYLECLSQEARRYFRQEVQTVYIGGGTPSVLPLNHLDKLFRLIRENFVIPADAEWTFEINPEDVTEDLAKFLFQNRVNRVSIGAQSFKLEHLKFLGRNHTAAQICQAFGHLRKIGFKNINLDMMFSFPDQTAEDIGSDIEEIRALNCDHVSMYSLSLESPSRFSVRGLRLPEDHIQSGYYELVVKRLERTGFIQYEISNFSKPGKESRHNLNYWQGGEYIGLGVGAHSHLSGVRSWNVSRLKDYMSLIQAQGTAVDGSERLAPQDKIMETLLFGLRMNRGVDLRALEQKSSGRFPDDKKQKIQELCRTGLLLEQEGALKATRKGRLVLDEISGYLI